MNKDRPDMHIERGGIAAEVQTENTSIGPMYHWLVYDVGKEELIRWGKCSSYDQAENRARKHLDEVQPLEKGMYHGEDQRTEQQQLDAH